MKVFCSNCKKELGLFSQKTKLLDGALCSNCLKSIEKVGMCDIEERLSSIKFQKLKEIYDNKKSLAQIFETDFQLGNMLIVDNINKLFVIDGVLLKFENLDDVEIKFQYSETSVSTTNSKTKKGVGKSIVGGLIFGPIGALVGGMTAGGKTKSSTQTTNSISCTSCKIILTLHNYYISKYFINITPSSDELRNVGCDSLEDFGNLIESELKQIINKKGEK